jgi:hypothetical protein
MKPFFLKTMLLVMLGLAWIQTNAANNAPAASGDSIATAKNTSITIHPPFVDTDVSDRHTIVITADVSNGVLTTVDDTTFTYTPNTGYVGLDTFTYYVCDDGSPALCAGALVKIFVGCDGLVVDAGKDSTLCAAAGFMLGGSPTAQGGSPPYIYSWVDVPAALMTLSNPTVNLTADKVYVVKVTDGSGCIATGSIAVNMNDSSIFVSDTVLYSCGSTSGTLDLTVTSAYGPLSYSWNTGDITEDIIKTIGRYRVTITNNTVCSFIKEYAIDNGYLYTVVGEGRTDTLFCFLDSFKLGVYYIGNEVIPPYTYSWTSSDPSFSSNTPVFKTKQNASNTYYLTVTNGLGCTNTDSIHVIADTCMWPGDANYDGIVQADDVLRLGTSYGATGRYRVIGLGSIAYIAQQGWDWNNDFADGLNYKHADCNGDGFVNHVDTMAISVNYGLTHARSGWVNGDRSVDPRIYTTFSEDTIYAGNRLTASVWLGESSLPVANILGISFRMHFPAGKIDSFLGIHFTGNWITAGNTNPIYFRKAEPGQGFVDVCIVRTDHNDNTGFGLIANADFVMKDDITGKNDNRIFSAFPVSFSNVKMITANEQEVQVFAEDNEAVLAQYPLGLQPVREMHATVYPNPAHETILLVADGVLKEVLLTNSIGESAVVPMQINGNAANINASALAAGVYYLHLTTANGKAVKRIVKY